MLVHHLPIVAGAFSICPANHFSVLCCSTSTTFNLLRSLFAIIRNFNAAKILIFHVKRARINKNMTKCGNFLCLLVQLRLKITKWTPIFVRLSVKLHISFRSKPSNGYSKLSDGHPKLCVDTTIYCCKHYTMFNSDSISTVCSDSISTVCSDSY